VILVDVDAPDDSSKIQAGVIFTLGEMETGVQVALRNVGVFTLSTLCGLGQEKHKTRVRGHKDVGDGKHWLSWEGNREKSLDTLFGKIRFHRAYYHGENPLDSRWPRDEELGLKPGQIWSPGLQDVADYLATATGSYQAAEKSLLKTLRVQLQYKQIQRNCLDAGADIAYFRSSLRCGWGAGMLRILRRHSTVGSWGSSLAREPGSWRLPGSWPPGLASV